MRVSVSPFWLVWSALTLLALQASEPARSGQEPIIRPAEVLVVNSYHQGYRWSDDIVRGLQEALRQDDRPIKLHIECLDSKRHPLVMRDPALLDFMHAKYDGTHFDAIITCDDNATWFTLRERDRLFPAVPVVFCGVNDLQPERLRGLAAVTGVNEAADLGETIACMLRLHPGTDRLLVITDRTETGQGVTREIERWRPGCPAGVGLELVNDVTQAELADLVGQARSGTLILYTFFFQDRAGRTFDAEESARLVVDRARVPVYTTWDFNQGFGMVGGKLTSGYCQGRSAGDLARRILARTAAAALPVRMASPNRWVFEHAALERFGIRRDDLPAESLIIGEPDSPYYRYRLVIWAALAIGGVMLAIIVILTWNIRLRLRAEQALRRSEHRYREMVDTAVDGILSGDLHGVITGANPRMAEITGLPLARLVGLHVSRIFDPDTIKAKPLRFDLLDQGQTVISERTVLRPDGSRLAVEMHSRRMPDGGYQSIYRDITARKLAEAAVLEANLRREAFFQGARDAILVSDPATGLLVEVNREAESLLGRPRCELVNLPLAVIHPASEEEHDSAAFRSRTAGASVLIETEVQHRDGTRIPVEISSRGISLPDGRKLLLGVVRDIRERQRMAEQLRQAEKLTAIGQLAGGVAHDFNNQLAGILGYAELLAKRLHDDLLRRYADGIIRSALRASDLTKQLLAFARKGRNLSVPTDPDRLVLEVVELLQHSIDKRIEIRQHLESHPAQILGDPTQLQNALLNLGLNARDAMPQGGVLTFATRLAGDAPDQIEIVVSDTGIGMDAAVRQRLFEPFFTTKQAGKGTGLGLAAVYGTVQNHGGTITVASEPGHGSTFIIRLPRLREPPSSSSRPTTVRTPLPRKMARILVVEDEDIVRSMVEELLGELGYQVISAADGETAIARFQAEWRDLDLVLLDLILPRMGGAEVFAALQRINAKVRVVVSSGYSLDGTAQGLLDAGAMGFVQKPYQADQIAAAIDDALKRGKRA